ncbi:dynein heavy chain [Coemansia sp. RSA 1933]|nr:dynein heavy chain [Coemansia sp. RSA 1933]
MEELVDHPSSSSGDTGERPAATAPFCDPNIVKRYLMSLVPVLLGSGQDMLDDGSGDDDSEESDFNAIRAMFSNPEASVKCKSFANDASVPVLYVVKETTEQAEEAAAEEAVYGPSTRSTFGLSFELLWKPTHVGSVALIKRVPTLDPAVPLARQIQVMNLPGPASTSASSVVSAVAGDGQAMTGVEGPGAASGKERAAAAALSTNPYEALHAYLRFAVSPYFNAYVAAKEKAEQQAAAQTSGNDSAFREEKDALQQGGIPMAKKKLAELELSLLHLQQNMEIPEVVLNIHPAIVRAADECRRQGKRASSNAIGPALLADSAFLNQLQGDVNGWIKEIQKVTKLDRDPGSGTTSQEINFWLSMERALERIEEQLQSDEIQLTMDVLKAAKRFHATVSFRTDTGLKKAAEQVARFNVLMKDFPINELLSATDIGRISTAVEQVFAHVNKKLKLTAYPVRRALPLVEAISRDFNDQLVKVLSNVRLMSMEYVGFDRLFRETHGAFGVWDNQVKEFTNLARNITHKRSEKFIPIKFHAAHAALQERFQFVHLFRQQHEQLQNTISKVMGTGHGPASASSAGDDAAAAAAAASDATAIEEIRTAYDIIKVVDVLDVTPYGAEQWERASTSYNERVARVENQIIVRLRDRLAIARNASEMFRVFSKFNALFVRPKIRGAIQEYQTQLINSVKDDIRRLHDTFKRSYHRSEAYAMSQLRDVPPVSGLIIWIRQIEQQLTMYMSRVENVLGAGWEQYAEGQRLQADSASFRRKLETRPYYDSWFNEISRRDLTVSGRVFDVARQRAAGNTFQLSVRFDAQLITLFKEVRALLWLGFQVPHTLVSVARDGKRVYPYAVSLTETTKIYRQASHRLHQHQDVMALAAGYRSEVMACIGRGMGIKWQYFLTTPGLYASASAAAAGGVGGSSAVIESHENRNAAYVHEFASHVGVFQEKVETLIALNDDINAAVRELGTCPYAEDNFRDILDRIQALIDRLNLDNYANLEHWVAALDQRIERVLTVRLAHAIHAWILEFNRMPAAGDDADTDTLLIGGAKANGSLAHGLRDEAQVSRKLQRSMGVDDIAGARGVSARNDASDASSVAQLRPLVHELRIKNQVMYLDPPLENARASWIQQLHAWLAAICQQRRPQAARYEVVTSADDDPEYDNLTLEYDPGHRVANSSQQPSQTIAVSTGGGKGSDSSYKDLLSRLPDNSLFEAYRSIETMTKQAASYVQIWLQYQALWDLQIDYVLSFLGDDLTKWQSILLEIRRARSTFDNSETVKYIGAHCVVDYEQVQSKVNARYDSWQREILNKFGQRLGQAMRDTCQAISSARLELESHSAESSTTSEVVTFITFVQELKRKCPQWRHEVEEAFRGGQRVLEKLRYQFPQDWMYLDQVEGEWSAFNEILKRKNNVIQEQLPSLQMKIIAEDKAVDQRITQLCGDWEKSKPVQGSLKPDVATNTLSVFFQRITRLVDEYEQVCRAKEALDMDISRDERLTPVREEANDLKAVWAALSGIWREVDGLRETPWVSVVVRKVRQRLDALLTDSKQLPNRMRQYAAFEYMQKTLRGLLKANSTVADLKSDALRDRHWRQLAKALRVSAVMSDLTLGDVWDFDILRNESIIREVITVAQGEMALEEFIGQIRETWTGYVLELVPYQNKCRLIKGWDDLFAKCSEQLSALTAMKASPYYKVFEEEAGSWEDKLNRIHVLFDVWVDVQRQWVYLEGIFTSSADIKHMLPVESSRFQNINTEFLAVMKRVYKSPFVLDVLNLPNIQRSLERLADLLSKIQKALGDYLERERASFPRFYFVGDEDLLEIIGNAKDVPRIQKHLRKMFAGLAFIQISEDGTEILGMSSREGERIVFREPLVLKQYPKINDWLAAIEREMRLTLADLLGKAVAQLEAVVSGSDIDAVGFRDWIAGTPAQLVVLAKQVVWTRRVDGALADASSGMALAQVLGDVERELQVLADAVLEDLEPVVRKKSEHLITELVHQRDVIRLLIEANTTSAQDFVWLSQMRFSYAANPQDPLGCLVVHMADAQFRYGFEYLGVQERLVQTPLTDRCYLTMTQALERRLGGSPFGPAGTGKTESVKALATQLGRFALVFCCDENFDFQAMGRIFVGLCQVGAWGVFDEFNRLDERILSAVSQQIQTIQLGLRRTTASSTTPAEIELLDHKVRLHPDTGIFITMNPGYAGRSNLPDNLKKLFRSFAMTKPDRDLIAQVMLYSQGFRQAELLASKVVPLFNLCAEQLSQQPHYDFGLRALKSVLVSAGNLKRGRLLQQADEMDQDTVAGSSAQKQEEQGLVIQSIRETVVPKLVAQDIQLLSSLLDDVFPGVEYRPASIDKLREAILAVCQQRNLVPGERWMDKVVQLYQIQAIHHGLMMVGASGSGKSAAWQVLLAALERMDGIEGVSYVIDPKAVTKDDLYGTLDATTREWRDGLFTHLLRKIVDNVRGESTRRHWIVFDGDVDPEWVENLNSVLDDNKLLTLPNGERLALPPNVRIMFEVETLRYATLATVSRCGMVWFSDDTVAFGMVVQNYLRTLQSKPLDEGEESAAALLGTTAGATAQDGSSDGALSPAMQVQAAAAAVFEPHFGADGLVERALAFAGALEHIMDFTHARVLSTLFTLLNKAVLDVVEYNAQHADFPLTPDVIEAYLGKRLVLAIVWAFTGDAPLTARKEMSDFVRGAATIDLPPLTGEPGNEAVIDYDAALRNGSAEWTPWADRVPRMDIETHRVTDPSLVVPTTDTLRHEDVLNAWLSEHKPLVLCGPPGSGKTMTLLSALRSLPDLEVAALNFSSATTPELILKTFEQHCEYRKTPGGVVLSPVAIGRWLVVFCDEINLPAPDRYGTQRVIAFMRELVERGGFWRAAEHQWVTLERVQFVGACNPPTDPGRVPLSHRFLRHAPLVMVDYPGEQSLLQIYGVLARAMLKVQPQLRAYSDPLTRAMVDVYLASQRRFTPDQQAHYVYSPRELTRWTRGMYDAMLPLETLNVEGLVRLWAHEGLRLFQDRLVDAGERRWTDDRIDEAAHMHFPTIDQQEALARPILFSNWLTRNYVPVDREELRDYVRARLRVFYEEELDVPLVLFNDVLDHVLRIDRVFRQHQGHALLIGVSGAGKTTLARFVAWMNGLSVYQIKAHNRYRASDFDDDLRAVLRRSGCGGEKICFVLDESNVLDAGFLERMNTLLANSEVPGLFEGDEQAALMTACREGAARDGLMLDSNEELYRWFTQQVSRNLHVVFTMNPPADGLASRAATSPALFNRCVLDWFGDWSDQALYHVGREFTASVDLDVPGFVAPDTLPVAFSGLELPATHRDTVVNAFVAVHKAVRTANVRLAKRRGRVAHVTPRHYLDFIQHFTRMYFERRDALEEQQRHVNVGLDKLQTTVKQVEELRQSLAAKKEELAQKTQQANDKLRQMVQDQQEAEQKQAASLSLQAELESKNAAIEERRKVVVLDLERAEPAVEEAQRAVSNIKKQQLTELRAMANPPSAVKLAMESVCTLLGHKQTDWKSLQSIIRRDDFIASIVNFDTDRQMNRALRALMRRQFLERPEFNFETVNRASKACGPLVKWVAAQVEFAEILDRVGPLRNEVKQLEYDADETKVRAATLSQMIAELEASIARYKDEYALLIAETERLKGEMTRVEAKVERSLKLLESLGSERVRWEAGSADFDAQMGTLVGDVLLGGALHAYGGFYDQQDRDQLVQRWTAQLLRSGIAIRADMRLAEYLSSAEERLVWQSCGLADDSLAMENAAMLQHFNRYPLVVDPSGTAAQFLQQSLAQAGRKLTVTSFLDDAFLKQLESALRFGNPILITDVEHLDPILNPVLNRELRRTGGRVLLRLGSQDIDFSPAFRLFLSTRDPSAAFAPDLSSRVTFVNFTVTRASLQAQCLGQVMRHERPDVDERRRDLLKLQGEFRLRLHALEKELLRALNAAQGNILDDDAVIATLETLKTEAAEISRKVDETDGVMREVDRVTATFTPLARSCAAVYFALDRLSALHPFYQFSLDFFNAIFRQVVEHNGNLHGVGDERQRLDILRRDLFRLAFARAAASLHHDSQLVLLLQLAQIRLRSDEEEDEERDEILDDKSQELWARLNADLDFLLREASIAVAGQADGRTSPAVPAQLASLVDDDTRASMAAHAQSLGWCRAWMRSLDGGDGSDGWMEFMASTDAERRVPRAAVLADDELLASKPEAVALRELIVVRLLRPDRVLSAAARFAAAVFAGRQQGGGPASLESAGMVPEADLREIATAEVEPTTPIALCSVPGYDAANRVDALAEEMRRSVLSVAMGSVEGFALADQAIASAAKSGAWVLLKNVHLAPAWLAQLEKRLQSLRAHLQFRLFLTMEINPAVPASLLRRARTLVYEPAPGIRANLLESLNSAGAGAGAGEQQAMPAERTRLHFLLAWLHSVVIERLRYAPLGWTSRYEFSDADFACARLTVDRWIDRAAAGKANIDPVRIPWDAIRTLLTESVYGGRIDNDFDHHVLETFVAKWFSADAYGADFALVDGDSDNRALLAPEGTKREDFVRWCHELPENEPPTWLGLPANAETLLLVQKGQRLVGDVRKMRSLMDDDDDDDDEGATGAQQTELAGDHAEQPAYMRQVETLASSFATALPAALPALSSGDATAQQVPLFRVIERENAVSCSLLAQILADLTQLREVCRGERKQTNHLRQLLADFSAGIVPQAWVAAYTVPRDYSLTKWISDFANRLDQNRALVDRITHDPSGASIVRELQRQSVWLGGLLYPEAFITATRQAVAKQLHCSLEELVIAISLENNDSAGEEAFAVAGLRIEGAVWVAERKALVLNDGGAERLAVCFLRWIRRTPQQKAHRSGSPGVAMIPVYLNMDRSDLLFEASLPIDSSDGSTSPSTVVQRAVAIIAA